MTEDKEKKSLTSYFTKKVVATMSAVAAVFTLVAGIWAFETHYATNNRVDGIVMSAKEDVEDLEVHIAGALERQQQKSDVRYFQFEYDKILNDIYEIKRQIRRYPEDEILKQDLMDLLGRKKTVKEKLEKALEKIKVN